MGWCSATYIFDDVIRVLHENEDVDKETTMMVARVLYDSLTDGDWDCQDESDYFKEYVLPIMIEKGRIDKDDLEHYLEVGMIDESTFISGRRLLS